MAYGPDEIWEPSDKPIVPDPIKPKKRNAQDRYPTTSNPFGPGKYTTGGKGASKHRGSVRPGALVAPKDPNPWHKDIEWETNNNTLVPKGWTAAANGDWIDPSGKVYNMADKVLLKNSGANITATSAPAAPAGPKDFSDESNYKVTPPGMPGPNRLSGRKWDWKI